MGKYWQQGGPNRSAHSYRPGSNRAFYKAVQQQQRAVTDHNAKQALKNQEKAVKSFEALLEWASKVRKPAGHDLAIEVMEGIPKLQVASVVGLLALIISAIQGWRIGDAGKKTRELEDMIGKLPARERTAMRGKLNRAKGDLRKLQALDHKVLQALYAAGIAPK